MILKTNSLSAKYYRWFYGYCETGLPKNLCPYFWKSVFAWLIAIPYVIFSIPVILKETFDKDYKNGDHSTGARIGLSIFVYFALFILFLLGLSITLFFTSYTKGSFLYEGAIGGVTLWVAGAFFGIGLLIKGIFEYFKNRKREKRYQEIIKKGGRFFEEIPKENVIIEFIKAKYNSYCPSIEWVKEIKKED